MQLFSRIASWFKRKGKDTSIDQNTPSMDVQEFVQASIIGIMSGIKEAQIVYANDNSAYAPLICPAWGPSLSDIAGGTKGYADRIHDLEFDLAVTVTSTSALNSTANVGVKVVGVYAGDLTGGLECSGSEESEKSRVSRIKFKVPVRYPLTKLTKAVWDE